VVWSNPCTKVGGTAKICTDEQKPYKRHDSVDEVAHHTEVRRIQEVLLCRYVTPDPQMAARADHDQWQAHQTQERGTAGQSFKSATIQYHAA
jgi:hypothetical protein